VRRGREGGGREKKKDGWKRKKEGWMEERKKKKEIWGEGDIYSFPVA
jgi:hypothetical protein